MNNLKEFLTGAMSESDKDQVFEKLITAKLDRDKKREWQQKLKGEYGVERNGKYGSLKRTGLLILSFAASFYYFRTIIAVSQ